MPPGGAGGSVARGCRPAPGCINLFINVALADEEIRPGRETIPRRRRYRYASACEKQIRRHEAAAQPEQRSEAGVGRPPGATGPPERRPSACARLAREPASAEEFDRSAAAA